MLSGKKTALVLAGHGSTQNKDSSLPTRRHAAAIAERALFAEVEACFWLEEPFFKDVLSRITAPDIFIVPNFISEGYYTGEILPREFKLEGAITKRGEQTVYYCEPVGKHPFMTDLLIGKAGAILKKDHVAASETCLFIAGHGTPKNIHSTKEVYRQVELVRALGTFGQVEALFMEEAPYVRDWHSFSNLPNAIVVPFFIADGLHPAEDIPVMLGIGGRTRDPDVNQPFEIRGRRLWYSSSIGTDPGMVDVILAQVEKFKKEHGI